MDSTVTLVIIYNHKFEDNIARCEALYRSKFDLIFHLMPFYSGDNDNVIPVYEHSFYFQGYVAQGLKMFFREESQHYFFIADDMVLNPVINQYNYKSIFKLDTSSSFISRISSLSDEKQYWSVNARALKYNPNLKGCEIKTIIPLSEELEEKLKIYGVENNSFTFSQVYGRINAVSLFKWFRDKLLGASLRQLKYPMARSYSDIFIVDKHSIDKFAQVCGAFAATELFVELAIPTALVISCSKIVTEKQLEFRGRALWSLEDLKLLDQYHNKLENLLKNYPKSYLYIHPIKLSKWS